MKKLMILLLAMVLLLSLCACGGEKTPETTAATAGTTEPAIADTTAPIADTTAPAADPKALAESCIDKPLEDLIALIGEPQSSDYAPSCLNPGVGEDGNLYYDGFTVYTYREGDTETVTYVE